ncbi:hypothetical protein IU11_17035 [Cellulosimicrobium sp. MM]|nr:hypothetical protein IU11_17035 [Cellulosimicrobium sp. MM]
MSHTSRCSRSVVAGGRVSWSSTTMRTMSDPAARRNGPSTATSATTAAAAARAAVRHPAPTSSQRSTTSSGTTPQILTVAPSSRTAPPAQSHGRSRPVPSWRRSRPRSSSTTPPSRHREPRGSRRVSRSAHAAAYDSA